MKHYLRFDENGRQVETTLAPSKPSSEFYVAPSGFDPAKTYERQSGSISEVSGAALEAEQLAALKTEAKGRLIVLAETARGKWITPGDGKAMVYREKYAEAKAYQADATAECPMLSVEAAARGIPLADMVQIVLDASNGWVTAAAQIEALTVTANAAIEAAGSVEDLDAALGITWP
ncbi:hypothetical protein [Roseibium sp.]|uniref:hypothetical protein n=1 Tax=Roseibium sp. TaxID=1936156 RepID=UPI003D143E02